MKGELERSRWSAAPLVEAHSAAQLEDAHGAYLRSGALELVVYEWSAEHGIKSGYAALREIHIPRDVWGPGGNTFSFMKGSIHIRKEHTRRQATVWGATTYVCAYATRRRRKWRAASR
jgi:hypothetical protein